MNNSILSGNYYFNHIISFIFLLLIIDSSIAITANECKVQLDRCQKDFFKELKQFKFNDENAYHYLCGYQGVYDKFLDCLRQVRQEPECTKPAVHREICNQRNIKFSTYRYTWRASLIHDICFRSSTVFSEENFKHEKCMSEVMNQPNWDCDINYYKYTKTPGEEGCRYWKDFRQCVFEKVDEKCGSHVANLSDYLFHVHMSYFKQYNDCKLPGQHHTKCLLDIIHLIPKYDPQDVQEQETTTITPSTTTTTTGKTTTAAKILASTNHHGYSTSEVNMKNKPADNGLDDDEARHRVSSSWMEHEPPNANEIINYEDRDRESMVNVPSKLGREAKMNNEHQQHEQHVHQQQSNSNMDHHSAASASDITSLNHSISIQKNNGTLFITLFLLSLIMLIFR